MPNEISEYKFEDLAYPLHAILGIEEDEQISILDYNRTNTAVTLRVSLSGQRGSNFFVKTTPKMDVFKSGTSLGLREVAFYKFIDSFDPELLSDIPKCIRHHISDDGKKYYLVLQDLSHSHQDYSDVDFTDIESWQYALRSLASFHKCLTGKLTKHQIKAHTDDKDEIRQYLDKLHKSYGLFRDYSRDRLNTSIFSLLEKSLPLIREIEYEKFAHIQENNLTTILHRDAHIKNFLYPRHKNDAAKIVDWQFWGMGIGTYDLRHLLGSALTKDMRRYQKEFVHYYYQHYIDGMNFDYSWEDCWEDYRKGIIDNLFMPVWQFAGFGWGYEKWENTLRSAVDNYYALNCDSVKV